MRNKKGFTFIELLITIAIIGILGAILIPRFVDLTGAAKVSATQANLAALRSVLAIKYAQSATGGGAAAYPASVTGTDFAENKEPLNQLSSKTGITVTTGIPAATGTHGTNGFWYIQTGASAGRAGAFSDGTVDTSNY